MTLPDYWGDRGTEGFSLNQESQVEVGLGVEMDLSGCRFWRGVAWELLLHY